MTDANERRSAGRATGLLWLVGGISGAPDGDVDSLLEAADRRLRRAKGEGKDRWDAGAEEVGVHVNAT